MPDPWFKAVSGDYMALFQAKDLETAQTLKFSAGMRPPGEVVPVDDTDKEPA